MPHTLNDVAVQRYEASFKPHKLGGKWGDPHLSSIYPLSSGLGDKRFRLEYPFKSNLYSYG